MIVPEIKEHENLGIAIRLVNSGCKDASEICNSYWECANKNGKVLFGSKTNIDFNRWCGFSKIYLFADNRKERFIGSANILEIYNKKSYFRVVEEHPELKEYLRKEDEHELYKTWFVLSNFEQIDIQSCELRLYTKPDSLFRDEISTPRFKMCILNLGDSAKRK